MFVNKLLLRVLLAINVSFIVWLPWPFYFVMLCLCTWFSSVLTWQGLAGRLLFSFNVLIARDLDGNPVCLRVASMWFAALWYQELHSYRVWSLPNLFFSLDFIYLFFMKAL